MLNCNTIVFKDHIKNSTFYQTKVEALSPTNRLSLKYNISFRADKCCPLVALSTEYSKDENNHRDPKKHCYLERFQNIALLSQYYIYLSEWNPYSGCKKKGSYYVCSGTRNFYVGTEVEWYIDIGYECRIQQFLDISVEMEFMCNPIVKCETMRFNYCNKFLNYNQTSFPNTLGHTSQYQGLNGLQLLIWTLGDNMKSHKYAREFICYSLLPPCVNGKPIIPCKQACIEIVKTFESLLLLYRQPLYCGTYPSSLDPKVCFYRPVLCPKEEDPKFGRVIQSGTQPFNVTEVVCNPGYEIVGDRIRHCLYSGLLNGSKPQCVLKTNMDDKTKSTNTIGIIVGSVAVCVVIILVVFITISCRKENSYQVAERRCSLFVTYSNDDSERVQDELIPSMKFELPTWNVLTFQENFTGGENLLKAIHTGIWESTAVIAIVTPNYMRSEWCLYEFREAQTRSACHSNFKLIIIFLDENGLEKTRNGIYTMLPASMKTWIMGRVHLTVGEKHFWKKLRRSLPQ